MASGPRMGALRKDIDSMKQARLAFNEDGHNIGMAGGKRQGEDAVNLDKGAGNGEEEAHAFGAPMLSRRAQRVAVVGEGIGDWNKQRHAFSSAIARGQAQGMRVFEFGVGDGDEELYAIGVAVRCGGDKSPRTQAVRIGNGNKEPDAFGVAMVGGHAECLGVFHLGISAKLQKTDNSLGVAIFSTSRKTDGKLAFGELIPRRDRAAARVGVGVGHVGLCSGLA